MILGSVFADGHSNNSLFEEEDPAHRFNPTYTNRLLREEFRRNDVEINTADVNGNRRADFELHMEGRSLEPGPVPRFLIALENPLINALNADAAYLAGFKQVFTWNPRLAGMGNVTQICVPNRMVVRQWPGFEQRGILSCLINANKQFKAVTANDLYAERVAVIRWYEKHAPSQFDLYGLGWNKPWREPGLRGRAKRRVQRLATQMFGYRPFPSWRGEIADKSVVLLRSKFAYCYENVCGISGYVTEKIFDVLMCGCIPVYWGADDVASRIPPECFIDRRRFSNTAGVHEHLLSVSPVEYARRQEAIRSFLASEEARPFSSEYFAQVIVDKILTELGHPQAVRHKAELA